VSRHLRPIKAIPLVLESFWQFGLLSDTLLESEGVLGLSILDANVIIFFIAIVIRVLISFLLLASLASEVFPADYERHYDNEQSKEATDNDQCEIALLLDVQSVDIEGEGLRDRPSIMIVCYYHYLGCGRVCIGNSTQSLCDVFIPKPTLNEVSCAGLDHIEELTALRTDEGIIWNFVEEKSIPECVLIF
jgi:hypothetical protein